MHRLWLHRSNVFGAADRYPVTAAVMRASGHEFVGFSTHPSPSTVTKDNVTALVESVSGGP